MNNLLSVRQISFILNVHPLTVRRYIKEKKLKAVKIGGNVRIYENDLNEFHKDLSIEAPNKTEYKKFKKIPDNKFSLNDPFLRLQARAASLKLI